MDEMNFSGGAEFFENILSRFYEIMAPIVNEKLDNRNAEIGLNIVGDEHIRLINRDHRGFDKPTDVLSFAFLEGEQIKVIGDPAWEFEVGDIFISLHTASRQAKEHGHSLEKELEILFVHGLLHLFGFDHGDDEEEAEMEKWAKKILEI